MKDLQTLLDRHNIRHRDLAFITGRSIRSVKNWIDDTHPLPRSVELIIAALEDGKIDEKWLAVKLAKFI